MMTVSLGETPRPVEPTTLRDALELALRDSLGGHPRIVRLERRPFAYRTSYAIEELDVHLADGRTLGMVFKDLSRAALVEAARDAKPAFIHDPLREIDAYRTILRDGDLGTASWYGAIVDPSLDRYWLFVERVPATVLWQIGDLTTWQDVARWLARFHARFAAPSTQPARTMPLLRYDGALYRRWMTRARAAIGAADDPRAGCFARVAERYERVIEALVELPTTVIHGEFYASNILVQETESGRRVCPIDWEMAAIGPSQLDLAALTAGTWTEEAQRAMALAYYAALPAEHGTADTLLEALEHCRLHLAVQWLGWADGWTPPPEHAQDWLGEALRVAERLGL